MTQPMLSSLLSSAGYRVDVVYNGDDGLRQLEVTPYDIIIIKESPLVGSWNLCMRIRDISSTIPLIVISSNASTETCVKTINAGADYFMRKPFGPLELLARMRSLLHRAPIPQTIPARP